MPTDTWKDKIAQLLTLVEDIKTDLKAGNEFREASALGLFEAITRESNLSALLQRLQQNTAEKRSIATVVARSINDAARTSVDPHTVFIESGSTLGLMSAELGALLRNQTPPPTNLRVRTNNLLTLTALDFGYAAVVGGVLQRHYLAFLDFAPAYRPDRQREKGPIFEHSAEFNDATVRDSLAFRRLTNQIADVDTVYMTASDFGFLVGPMVGDRANAVFKYCLLNSISRRRTALCISFSKVLVADSNRDSQRSRFEELINHRCYCVFELFDGARNGSVLTNFPHSVIVDPDPLLNQKWAASNKAAEDNGRGPRCVPSTLGLRADASSGLCSGNNLFGLAWSWIDALEQWPSGHLELIVGLGSDDIQRRLSLMHHAIDDANHALETFGCQRRYKAETPPNQSVFLARVV